MADLSSGLIESKGLKSLNRSKRYNLKGKRFLNIFLPIAFYMLILEILTLLVCIVTFAPLSNAASNAFIFTIVLTALLLLLIPLILTFISGFKGDKAEHEEKRKRITLLLTSMWNRRQSVQNRIAAVGVTIAAISDEICKITGRDCPPAAH